MRKEIEKLDEEFYDNIEVIGVNGCLHRRDAKLLELVKGEVESRLWFHQGHDQEKINEGIYQSLEAIDKIKETINGKG